MNQHWLCIVRQQAITKTILEWICQYDSTRAPSVCYHIHYSEVTMGTMTSRITTVSIVYSTVCSGADQRKHQNSTSLAFVMGIHRWPVDSTHKGPVTRQMFPFDDVVMLKQGTSKTWQNLRSVDSGAVERTVGNDSISNLKTSWKQK